MGKLLVRLAIVTTSIYFLIAFYMAQFHCIDIMDSSYFLVFELCVVVYCFSEGKYHCKYIKYVALGLFSSDCLTRLDNYLNFLSVSEHNAWCACLIAIGIGVSIFKALMHFYKVGKLRQKRKRLYG